MYLRKLYPTPKSFTEDESVRYTFGVPVSLFVPSDFPKAWGEQMKFLWNRFTCTAGELTLCPCAASHALTIGTILPFPYSEGDGYALRADQNGVSITAPTDQGLYDGFKTLLQLICPDDLTPGRESFYISSAEVHDGGAIPFRSIHLCVFPETKLWTLEKAIRLAGLLKFTHVVLEFWGMLRYDCLPALAWQDRAFTKDEIRPLVRLANSLGMEVIPMANHLGHATASRVMAGRHVVLNQNPRLARLFEPDGWTWCVSSPETKKLLASIRDELYELCGEGKYVHLGLDEAYSFATCDRCRRRVPHELLAEYLNELTEDVCAHGRRPIVWHDQFLRKADFREAQSPVLPVANGDGRRTDLALPLLDRRIIMADWEYHYDKNVNVSTKVFMDAGFDVILCPWDNPENVRSLCANVKELNAFGVMMTTWHHLPAFLPKMYAAADDAWDASDRSHSAARTEAAALLRTVCPAPDFPSSGWCKQEVDE